LAEAAAPSDLFLGAVYKILTYLLTYLNYGAKGSSAIEDRSAPTLHKCTDIATNRPDCTTFSAVSEVKS